MFESQGALEALSGGGVGLLGRRSCWGFSNPAVGSLRCSPLSPRTVDEGTAGVSEKASVTTRVCKGGDGCLSAALFFGSLNYQASVVSKEAGVNNLAFPRSRNSSRNLVLYNQCKRITDWNYRQEGEHEGQRTGEM